MNKFLGKILKTISIRIRDKDLFLKVHEYKGCFNELVVGLLKKHFGLKK